MADKLSYDQALYQASALMGWIDKVGRGPGIVRERGMTIAELGPPVALKLQTLDSDIGSSWDPMDGDRQLRARDRLVDTLKRMRLQPGMSFMIDPSMWKTD
ncbi:hypothetical protein ISN75_19495 [Dyella marensis]|uniref:hypothetical protein n=2 Tax=Dyella TaxID=231454 RepID=UPI0031DEA74F